MNFNADVTLTGPTSGPSPQQQVFAPAAGPGQAQGIKPSQAPQVWPVLISSTQGHYHHCTLHIQASATKSVPRLISPSQPKSHVLH